MGEKFYPLFYDCVSGDEIVFKNLNRKCSVILGFELANSVLAHLSGTILSPENISTNISRNFFSVHGWKYHRWLEVSFLMVGSIFDGRKYHRFYRNIFDGWKYHREQIQNKIIKNGGL